MQMGMSSYVMDCEEKFDMVVYNAIKESEDVSEAMQKVVPHKRLVAHWTTNEVDEYVSEMWNEFWSEYASQV